MAQLHGTPFLITTTRRPTSAQISEAMDLAKQTGQPFINREVGAVSTLITEALSSGLVTPEVTGVLVVRQRDYRFWPTHGEEFQYHPGMAVHRIKFLEEGQADPMIDSMGLGPGESVLDCTAGLCSDALVAAHVVGERGVILGLEASLPVALVVAKGLETYESDRKAIVPAMRRIRVQASRAELALKMMASRSWDVVYFDPMFVQPVGESVGIAPLRSIADPSPLTLKSLQEAARVARRAVVVKDRVHGPWLGSGLFARHVGGANRRVGYAVLEGDALASMAEGAV